MARKNILHMITPLSQMSPFDVNMALDAGYDAVVPYVNVEPSDVTGLVQDAIFSRPPEAGADTGFFIAGKNVIVALDMFEVAEKAMLPPFAVSIFADPSGSFTTAAAMVAKVEKTLRDKFDRTLEGSRISIFGATGVVGFCAAVISAREGASVTLVGHDGVERVQKIAAEIKARFDLETRAVDGSTEHRKTGIVTDSEIILTAGKAGVQVISKELLTRASKLLIAADANAVPPVGIEGVAVDADGAAIEGTDAIGIGPLTTGSLKYKTEFDLFKRMIDARETLTLDFQDAFSLAREFVR